jgi:hypothetical protein
MRAADASAKALIFSSFQATIETLLPHVLHCCTAFLFLQELVAMRAADASAKALIFSSFQATIEQLQEALPGWGYSFRFINGERLLLLLYVFEVNMRACNNRTGRSGGGVRLPPRPCVQLRTMFSSAI